MLSSSLPRTPEREGSNSPYALVAVSHFESGPPASKIRPPSDDEDTFETVREEAWEERKKKTTTTTQNVERRVQRKLVLEDGEVVGDSGPVVTEDKKEDTVTQEVVSDEKQRPEGQMEALELIPREGWVATPGAVIISEKSTKTVKSHDEVKNAQETEEIQYCGDVTNKETEEHLKGRTDLRDLIAHRQERGWELAQPKKRVVYEAFSKKGNIDTIDVRETSKLQDGHVTRETERTIIQEKYENESAPDSSSSIVDGAVQEETKDTSHNLIRTKDEDILEYYAVPKGGTLAEGVKIGEGMHVVSEDVHEERHDDKSEPPSERLKKIRRPGRREALTKKPLDYNREELTRKSETNRWLEHHFGSESGSSSVGTEENDRHSSGGHIITITMNPRPATPEEITDTPIIPSRRWKDTNAGYYSKNQSSSPPSKLHFTPPSSPTFYKDAPNSELAAARARLRSTGRNLIEENKENNAPQRSFTSNNISSSNRFQSKTEIFSDPPKVSKHNKPKHSSPLLSRSSPSTVPNVGRSRSFNLFSLPWASSKKKDKYPYSKYGSTVKDYRSEEQLHDVSRHRLHDCAPPGRSDYTSEPSSLQYHTPSWKVKSTWRPPRESTPPPPPRSSRSQKFSSYTTSYSGGVEAGTQTGPSPIPPPRRKKRKPKNSYFFGDDINDRKYTSSSNIPIGLQNGTSHSYSHSHNSDQRYGDMRHTVPKKERMNKSTTVIPVNTDKEGRHYGTSEYHYSSNKSTWTNTMDPRRKPRPMVEETRPATLPKKLSTHNFSSPQKTYMYGDRDSTNRPLSSNYRGSIQNISSNGYGEESRFNSGSGKPVGRSQSFTVQDGIYSPFRGKSSRPLTEISGEKVTSQYRSSPYLNLRSPNLISNIVRSSSIQLPDAEIRPKLDSKDDKRNRFMEGLLNDAPELYHFIHGDKNENDNSNTPSQFQETYLNKTSSSNYSPSSILSPSARIFTFGRENGSTLSRTSPIGYENGVDVPDTYYNDRTSLENKRNSMISATNPKSTFNMKTHGSSLLYSPSLRNEREERRMSRNASITGKDRLSGDFTGRADIREGSPVLIQIRDWTMR